MKKKLFFLLIFIFVFPILFIIAQEDKDEEIPPGMEIIQVGNVKVLTIKGARVYEKNGLLTIEATQAYVARKFVEIEGRFIRLEAKIESLEKESGELKKALTETEGRFIRLEAKTEALEKELGTLKKTLNEIKENKPPEPLMDFPDKQ